MDNLRKGATYFGPLINTLTQRSERATQGLLGLGSAPLRDFLHNQLTGTPGSNGALLSDPVFEPTFGWEESEGVSMASLAGGLLHPKLVNIMSSPPAKLADDYAFPKDRRPFRHQLEAWRMLASMPPKSLVVTSGTGSGKTECFLVPILDSLVREAEDKGTLEGVRALFIYPLNALINSQQSRLDAWTHGLNGTVRHCLYTGALENEKKGRQREYNGQVIDRHSLRESPPPILVTNATILEYMLVRNEDESILKASEGKLRWIVLDEAHTYIGSQAAEMALLLRRVMLAFKVAPSDVRIVATSATFGSDEQTIESLRQFLADIGGMSPDNVHVIQGRRHIPSLMSVPKLTDKTLVELSSIAPANEISPERFAALSSAKTALQIRDLFAPKGQTRIQTLQALCQETGLSSAEALQWLDLLTSTKDLEGQAFLPLRAHIFHNVIPTVRACVDRSCSHKSGTALAHEDWPFGMVFTQERTHCDCCAMLLPLVSCQECNEPFLLGARARNMLHDPSMQQEDEFSLTVESDEGDEDGTENTISTDLLISNRPLEYTEQIFLEKPDGRLQALAKTDSSISLHAFMESACECPACGAKGKKEKLMRHARIGAPFTLSTVISTALEYCPPDKEPHAKPFNGRKMISFTDSRQGTARIAVKLQQDSERNRVRGLVYHNLLGAKSAEGLSAEDEQDLQDLLQEQSNGVLSLRDARSLQRLLDQKSSASEVSVSWDEMIEYLAHVPEIEIGMMDYYFDLAPNTFSSKNDVRQLAAMLLAREFYRRPKRANSLESLGLVQVAYPKLKQVQTAPTNWPNDVQSWRNYLKILLDFYVRENTFIQIDKNWLSIIGSKIQPKWLFSPQSDAVPSPRFQQWPSTNVTGHQSRAVLLLCKAFGWNTTSHRDLIDSMLRAAWSDLTSKQLLTRTDEHFQLSLKDISFRLPDNVYLCPVTRRFIDTSFEGLTPYTPRTDREKVIRLKPVDFPRPQLPLGDTAENVVATARRWAESEPTVQQLRQQGLWSDIHDIVVEGGSYFRAAEHSAQQSKKRLDRYEALFKQGKINLLSCSTTMEMGVDIGGITVVAMNNVPPHPANYLQRAGRAGRRREGRALAVTVCKNTPHDQAVFSNPIWPFVSAMRMPKVSLQSSDLVQRHINSWLLSHWLKNVIGNTGLKSMTAGSFFTPNGESTSLARRFELWCEEQSALPQTVVTAALSYIVSRSALSHLRSERLLQQAIASLSETTEEWWKEYSAALSQLKQLEGKRSVAYRAMEIQVRRIEKEYLLSELANRRFLPGYGFPTDIVSFDNSSLFTLKQDDAKGREDNRGRYRDLASRDRVTGLREYAPGAELVMDGLVYRSAGITLNWHAPASEKQIKEAQLLKSAWRCRECGASASSVTTDSSPQCESCGNDIQPDDIKRYLVPSGFAVDFLSGEPHNDITSLKFVPVKRPWLSIGDQEWVRLVNPALGQMRSSRKAHLFHYTSGSGNNGFALCLECGKAEPMLSASDSTAPANESLLPKVFRTGEQHKRLRGGKDDAQDPICPGSHNAWKIQQNVHLGHNSTTDALELLLCDPVSQQWLNNEKAAYSIAVALRNAIASELGVQSEELGCDSKSIRHHGQNASAIQVFDLRSGGYASQATEHINQRDLWKKVLRTLSCDCKHACQKCLLSFDTRFESDSLDRVLALEWINDEWINKLELPTQFHVFGNQTRAETASLIEAVDRELSSGAFNQLTVYLNGAPDDWDLSSARYLRNCLLGWQGRGLDVHLQIPKSIYKDLDEEHKNRLYILSAHDIRIELGVTNCLPSGIYPAISLYKESHGISWACNDISLVTPTRYWGHSASSAQLLAGSITKKDEQHQLSTEELQPKKETGVVGIDIHKELDGQITNFGERFWSYVAGIAPTAFQPIMSGEDSIKELIYIDRYVCNPLSAATLMSSLYAICKANDAQHSANIIIKGRCYKRDELRAPWQCWHDWPDSSMRDDALLKALNYCGLNGRVESLKTLPHRRLLSLQLVSGKFISIQLDQGFSYWTADRSAGQRAKFNFSASDIGDELVARLNVTLKAPEDEPTQIFMRTQP